MPDLGCETRANFKVLKDTSLSQGSLAAAHWRMMTLITFHLSSDRSSSIRDLARRHGNTL